MPDPWVSLLDAPGSADAAGERAFFDAEATVSAAQDAAQLSAHILRHLRGPAPGDLTVRAYAYIAAELLLIILNQLGEADDADAALVATLTPWADDQALYAIHAPAGAVCRA